MIQLLYASSVSACFELDSSAPFYAPLSFRIFLNGEEVAPLPQKGEHTGSNIRVGQLPVPLQQVFKTELIHPELRWPAARRGLF